MKSRIQIAIIILLSIVVLVQGTIIYKYVHRIDKSPSTSIDIANTNSTRNCVNEELGDIKIFPSEGTKSVIMVSEQDFMSKNKALDITNLDQLLKKYNKAILQNPVCSQQLLKTDTDGSYIYEDISTDVVFDKCWEKKDLDLDKDGTNEQVIIATIAMTKPPHVAGILKDGKLIFAYEGTNINISALDTSDTDKGFYLHVGSSIPIVGNNKKVKYVFTANNTIVPLWQEVYCN